MPVNINGSYDNLLKVPQRLVQVTQGVLLYAMDLQGHRMLERTAQGIDYNGSPFAAYNTVYPYYDYPAGKGTKGVRYESYDAFKKSLGRLVVDLRGPRDPHMLDQFELKVDGVSFKFGAGDYGAHSGPASIVTLGIYQTKGQLAYYHNAGEGHNPKRTFFAISASDKEMIFADISRKLHEDVTKLYA